MKNFVELVKISLLSATIVATLALGISGKPGAIGGFKSLLYIAAGAMTFALLYELGKYHRSSVKLRYEANGKGGEPQGGFVMVSRESMEKARANALRRNNRIFAVKNLALRAEELIDCIQEISVFPKDSLVAEEEIVRVAKELWNEETLNIAGSYFIGSKKSSTARMLYDLYIKGNNSYLGEQSPERFLQCLKGYIDARGAALRKGGVKSREGRGFCTKIVFANDFYRSKIASDLLSFNSNGAKTLLMLLTGRMKVIDSALLSERESIYR